MRILARLGLPGGLLNRLVDVSRDESLDASCGIRADGLSQPVGSPINRIGPIATPVSAWVGRQARPLGAAAVAAVGGADTK